MGEGKGVLHGRLVVITGATRGIGRSIAVEFAKEGAALMLIGRDKAKLEEVRSIKTEQSVRSTFLKVVCVETKGQSLCRWQDLAGRPEQEMWTACRSEKISARTCSDKRKLVAS